MKIYVTYRNADLTEGRGPMVADKAFLHKAHAEEYMDEQPGCMGRRRKWSQAPDDWELREVEVIEHSLVEARKLQERIKQQALAKLTPVERAALGL